MESFALQLIAERQEPLELQFHDCRKISSYSDMFDAESSYVFCDVKYSAKVVSEDKLQNVTLLLNGNEVPSVFDNKNQTIKFYDESFGERIFQECFGYVQIVAIYEDDFGQHKVESNYIQVMVKKGRQNDSICRMVDFVYKNNPELLYGKPISKNSSDLKDFADKTIESHIKLLADILKTYENNYSYFKANARYKTTPKEIVDNFEKLQYVSTNTLQYIAMHPDQLQRTNIPVAIKIGNSRYLPQKTLIVDSTKTYDIFENQIIVGFLKYLQSETVSIKQKLESLEKNIPHKRVETKDYVLSTIFVYKNIISVLKLIIEKIDVLYQKASDLYSAYAKILRVSEPLIIGIPCMSHIFKSIPQYHQIYNCIEAWFNKGVFSLGREKFILSFMKMSQLYEVYVLSKMISFFDNTGLYLESSEKILYPKPQPFFENTTCNNCFKYQTKDGSIKATLYYQPVIYKKDMQHVTGIGLYRNTSISFPKSNDNYGMVSATGTYYTPDYLLKIENSNDPLIRYIIADAKLSQTKTVRTRYAVEVIYKYLFSISPLQSNSSISSLFIFNGFLDENQLQDDIYPIHDNDSSHDIYPRAEIISLSEYNVENEKLHKLILKHSIGGGSYKNYIEELAKIPTNEVISEDLNGKIEYASIGSIVVPEDKNVFPKKKISQKVSPLKTGKSKTPIKLSDLLPNKKDLERFKRFTTINEILPLHTKQEFDECKLFDRSLKRILERKLKQRNYFK
ncbi:DUF2357 domain-containing protein [Fibrobacter sp.]|uniref:DUF2357 domain-containing protein n=1 Tax=Fibrobacter sp. TaxID=35828 RepID=UPI00388F634E